MDQPTWIGHSLNGRYKIDALLGKGGMSAVYKALDPNLKRVVAIKLIHPHLSSDDDFIYRFKKEAAAVAALRHSNIVQVYDFNAEGEVYYMVLEFVPGETLQDRLKELNKSKTKMPIEQAIKIVLNVCDAIGYAHRLGMIHRDIKPANIMLDVHGQAILMDFGIVKMVDDNAHTATGAVVGTAKYMSPEVIRAELPDNRSDIYSLGITFYEMLSGQPPFNADSAMSLLMRHLNDPVPDLKSLRSDVPPELVRIINKSLEKDREKRYSSANEMSGDLKRLLTTLETAPVPIAVSIPQPDSVVADAHTEIAQSPSLTSQTEPWTDPKSPLSQQASVIDEPTKLGIPAARGKVATTPQPEAVKPDFLKAAQPAKRANIPPLALYGGAGIVIIFLCVAGWFVFRNVFSGNATPSATETPTLPEVAATVPVVIANTEAPALTSTDEPTATIAPTATNTLPPLYVRINNITINGNNFYVVEYETFGYTEVLPGQHIHFFFNTVPVEQAGMPGTGNWKIYGGPRPFAGYSVSSRSAGATQLCALVANPNHSIIPESGNCFDLP